LLDATVPRAVPAAPPFREPSVTTMLFPERWMVEACVAPVPPKNRASLLFAAVT
jgi:hypothetical protein